MNSVTEEFATDPPEREKVRGAPCLRTPYHPHQLVGVIAQISNRSEAHAA
jgi:hypothetical protein